jgi:vitamin K-dependent gamma-carboxylase
MKFNLSERLLAKRDAINLDVFRILFGLVLLFQYYSFYSVDFIDRGIIAPKFLFSYDLTPFIVPLPEGIMKIMMLITLIAPIFIMLGKFFKVALWSYIVCFGYFFLLDESYYNNHFYVILLLCFLFLFYSPKEFRKVNTIPVWLLFLFQFQIVVVYFFGGVVKLNYDWLILQQPIRSLMEINAPISPFPELLKSEAVIYYLAYGGVIFDLCIGFLLWWRKTRIAGILLSIIFHLTNLWIFNFGYGGEIGIFPFLMIASNLLFLDSELLRNYFSKWFPTDKKAVKTSHHSILHTTWQFNHKALYFVYLYILIQLILPFRHYLSPVHVDWTGQGQYFAWRMKIYSKTVQIKFTARRFPEDKPVTVQLQKMLNTIQVNMMGQHADMVYKTAQYIVQDLENRLKIKDPIINAEIKVSYNGRPFVYFVDPNVNLAKVTYNPYGNNSWVMPKPE